ncbi:hypothetical protein GCM10010448_07820 [Streptomyces glomeratus]|uniref:Uncharacterized protein n=1 Tax=Streptomyces glomeratus TaxID=284452 RepID=A0ABP6L011_9ACTN
MGCFYEHIVVAKHIALDHRDQVPDLTGADCSQRVIWRGPYIKGPPMRR